MVSRRWRREIYNPNLKGDGSNLILVNQLFMSNCAMLWKLTSGQHSFHLQVAFQHSSVDT